jgi:uncharacterized membrane protein
MGILSFLRKPKEFFSAEEKALMVQAIRDAERQTSGEIRLYVESRNPLVNVLERAAEVFWELKMEQTEERNAVLLYIAMKDKELALFGDEGIHQKVGAEYWNKAVKLMIAQFSEQSISAGIVQCINDIGQTLKEQFPYDEASDKDELSNDIVFGK